MPFQIIRNDITKVHADAIVNTANPMPEYGGGTDYAVYQAAGAASLLAARRKIGRIAVGEANVTPAFRLHAKYIIHTVGPIWRDGNHREFEGLASCYRKSLNLAHQLGCESIAFPLISTGTYGFPKDKALKIALDTIREFLTGSDMQVTLVVFDRKAYELSADLGQDVRRFIDDRTSRELAKTEYAPDYLLNRPGGENRRQESKKRRPLAETGFTADDRSTSMADRAEETPLGRETADHAEEMPLGCETANHAEELSSYQEMADLPAASSKPEPRAAGSSEKHAGYVKKLFSSSIWGDTSDKKTGKPSADKRTDASVAKPSSKPQKASGTWYDIWNKGSLGVQSAANKEKSLADVVRQVGETFQERLLRMMEERKLDAPEVYKKANLDKKLFSKIKKNPAYNPGKQTAVALALALELNLDETVDLIGRAGLAFSPSSVFDLIIEYCIERRIYDVFEVNAILFEYEQPLLGCG